MVIIKDTGSDAKKTHSAICFINTNRTWGGGEKWHYDMATRMRKKHLSVSIMSDERSELLRRAVTAGLRVYPIKVTNLSFLNPLNIASIAGILKREKIETIILNLPSDLKLAAFASRFTPVKNLIYRRGLARPVRDSLLNRYLFRNVVTRVITNSEETKRLLLSNNPLLIENEKIKVIYNGIDLEEFDSTPSEQIYQREKEEIILGNAGRLEHQKGQKFLIEIAARLKAKNTPFKLLIAGEGELKGALQQLSFDFGVSDDVIFLGFIRNMKAFMSTLDIFLFPSLWEGFGYAIIEAMACKKPVIAFRTSSNPEIIDHNRTGFLANTEDIDDFMGKLESLIVDQHLRARFGEEGRKRVATMFTLERAVREVEETLARR